MNQGKEARAGAEKLLGEAWQGLGWGTAGRKQMLAQAWGQCGRGQWGEGVEEEARGARGHWDSTLQGAGKNDWNQLFKTLQGLAMCSILHGNT